MENQKPIDVLLNEHIAQHRKTQAVLWEEVAHVVQAARDSLCGFAYKLRTGRHDLVTLVSVVIEILDKSGATVKAEMNLSDYAQALLGLARVPCVLSASKLEHWGKTLFLEPRFVTIERIPGASKEDYSRWIRENMQEEDCELNCALTSQTSVTYDGNQVTLRYSVRRYV